MVVRYAVSLVILGKKEKGADGGSLFHYLKVILNPFFVMLIDFTLPTIIMAIKVKIPFIINVELNDEGTSFEVLFVQLVLS
jgi:hypothetical protein